MADDTTTEATDDAGHDERTEAATKGDTDAKPDRSSSSRKRSRKRGKKDKPAGSGSRSSSSRETARGSRRARSLKPALEEMFTGIGGAVGIANTFDGLVVVQGSPDLAKALDELAKQDPAVQRALEKLVAGSTWGQVITAVLGVAVPIAANHGVAPPGMVYTGAGKKAMAAMEKAEAEAEREQGKAA